MMNKDENKTREPMFDGAFIFGFLFCWASVFTLNYTIIKIDWPPLNNLINAVYPVTKSDVQSLHGSVVPPTEQTQTVDDLPPFKRN